MTVELVTGYAGSNHVTSERAGAFNLGLMGKAARIFVLDGCEATAGNGKVTISEGNLIVDGRHVRVEGSTDVTGITTSASAAAWSVKVKYTRAAGTQIEKAELVAVNNTNEVGNIADHDATVEVPLYTMTVGSSITNLALAPTARRVVPVGDANTGVNVGEDTSGSVGVVVVKDGKPVEAASSVGGYTHPVYVTGGKIKPLTGSVGSATGSTMKPVYMNGGTITAMSGVNIGASDAYMVAVEDGTIKRSTMSKGAVDKPVYVESGQVKECTGVAKASDVANMVKTDETSVGTTAPYLPAMANRKLGYSNQTVGSASQPVYLAADSSGKTFFAPCTHNVSASTQNIGTDATRLLAMQNREIVKSSQSIGSSSVPCYIDNGDIKACGGVAKTSDIAKVVKLDSTTGNLGTQYAYLPAVSAWGMKQSEITVGAASTPVWLDGGQFKACTGIAKSSDISNMVSSDSASIGTTSALHLAQSGRKIIRSTQSVGNEDTPAYLDGGAWKAGNPKGKTSVYSGTLRKNASVEATGISKFNLCGCRLSNYPNTILVGSKVVGSTNHLNMSTVYIGNSGSVFALSARCTYVNETVSLIDAYSVDLETGAKTAQTVSDLYGFC